MDAKIVRTCCFECHTKCGVLAHVRDGRLIKVEGDPDHPISRGVLCSKGLAATQILYHRDRINYPMKRTRPKGDADPGWERISWDEALDTIAFKLLEIKREQGAECVAFGQGTGRGTNQWYFRISSTFGSPNRANPSEQCLYPSITSSKMTAGKMLWWDWVDVESARCVVIWGSNRVWTEAGQTARLMSNIVDKGAKLIVVDPRFEHPLAHKADYWLPVRPGSDGALALAWLNVILGEQLYDRDFVEKWTNATYLVWVDENRLVNQSDLVPEGDSRKFAVWDPLRGEAIAADEPGERAEPALFGTFEIAGRECKTVLQLLLELAAKYSPEEAEKITWVPAQRIREAARMYASHSPGSAIDMMQGVEGQHTNGTQSVRALEILLAITGNIDVPGGHYSARFWEEMEGSHLAGVMPREQAAKRLGRAENRLAQAPSTLWWQAMISGKPYPIRAYVVVAGNPLSWAANTNEVRRALMSLEFLSVMDYFISPTGHLADIVLPAAHWTERDFISDEFCREWYFAQPRAVDPEYERWSDLRFYLELGKRIAPEGWPWRDVEEVLDYQLAPYGKTWAQLKEQHSMRLEKPHYKKYQIEGFRTPSGKVEVFSHTLRDLGKEPLPVYLEPAVSPYSTPELAQRYPLVLTAGRRLPVYYHSSLRNMPWLRQLAPEPEVELNTLTAGELGIEPGAWVWIETPGGKIRMKAKLTHGIHPRVVSATHGWWQGCPELGLPGYPDDMSNVNVLSDNKKYDPVTSGPGMRSQLCRISAVQAGS